MVLQFGKYLIHDCLIPGEARLKEIIIGPVHGGALGEGVKLFLSEGASLHFLRTVEHIRRHLVGCKIVVLLCAGTSIDEMHDGVMMLLLRMLDLRDTMPVRHLGLGCALLHHVQVFRRRKGRGGLGIGAAVVGLIMGGLLLQEEVLARRFLGILLRLGPAVLKPVLSLRQPRRDATRRVRQWNTYVDLVQRHAQLFRKILLHHRGRLRELLIMRLQDIVLLLGETRLDVARNVLNAIGIVKRRLVHVGE